MSDSYEEYYNYEEFYEEEEYCPKHKNIELDEENSCCVCLEEKYYRRKSRSGKFQQSLNNDKEYHNVWGPPGLEFPSPKERGAKYPHY